MNPKPTSTPRHSATTTRLLELAARRGGSAVPQMCLALLACKCLLADWHRLQMLAVQALHHRGLLVRFRLRGTRELAS